MSVQNNLGQMNTPFIVGMRDAYFDELYKIFQQDNSAVFITADNGAPTLDKFASDFPEQYYTVGIAEEQMIGLAAGMAVEGRKVYTYAIAPFVTLRCAEFIKLDQCAMNVPIINLGVGAGYSYDIMGPTHHTMEDISLMRSMPNLTIWSPSDANMSAQLAWQAHYHVSGPQYIRFDRAGIPDLYQGQKLKLDTGLFSLQSPDMPDVTIISTGRFVYQAKKVAELLALENINADVIDVFRLKPFNLDALRKLIVPGTPIITYEEHYLNGGLGSIILEVLNDNVDMTQYLPILRIGQNDKFVYDMGGREEIWRIYGLDPTTVAQRIKQQVRR